MFVSTNHNYFFKQHEPVDICNANALFFYGVVTTFLDIICI